MAAGRSSPPRGRAGPLADVRVLDLAGLIPGPFCTQVLGDLGAEVIKVEPPGGESGRRTAGEVFETVNRNKRSFALDLKRDPDRERLYRLVDGADVLVAAFRPGAAARLGVDHKTLRARRPELVYCTISGFGVTAAPDGRPGHDLACLAAGGGLAFSGHWAEAPRRSGLPVADLAAGCYAAIAILAALRDRDRGGGGCHLDVAMADAAMSFAAVRAGRGLDPRNDARAHLYPAGDLFRTADGELVALSVIDDGSWRRFVAALAEEPALQDRRFDDDAGRRAHGDELMAVLAAAFGRRDRVEWLALARREGISIEPVRTPAEAAATARARARGFVAESDGGRQVLFPALRDGVPMARLRHPAPALGEDEIWM